jgi:hypothetical protein
MPVGADVRRLKLQRKHWAFARRELITRHISHVTFFTFITRDYNSSPENTWYHRDTKMNLFFPAEATPKEPLNQRLATDRPAETPF